MHEEGSSLIPLLLGSLALCYFGFEVHRRRNKLRSIFNVFDREESEIAVALEQLVQSGALQPFMPAASS